MNHVSIESKDNPSEKAVLVEEEIDGIDVDDSGNLEDLPRLVFVDEQCASIKAVVHSVELIISINKNEKQEVSQAYRCLLPDENAIYKSFSSIGMWNIVNHLGMHGFSCG